MPELPDLAIVAEELASRLAGRTVLEATAPTPILVRATPDELAALNGSALGAARRRGKFLLLPFERDGVTDRLLAANPMLAGRFWITPTRDRVRARTGLRLRLDDRTDLRYVDREMLGKLYLVAPDAMADIPGWGEMGPDADDPELTLDAFRARIRRHPGELKPLLRNPRFVAGIGNAYSDEILWEARLAPFRKRSTLTDADVERLYLAMRSVLADAVDRLRVLVPPEIETQHREAPPPPTMPVPAPQQPGTAPAEGREYRIDSAASLLTIRVYRGGALSRAGHNHVIASHSLTGVARLPEDPTRASFEVHLPVTELVVDEEELRAQEGPDFPPGVPEDAKEGTKRNMLGPSLLEADRYPEIVLQSEAIQRGPDGLQAQVRVIVRDRASAVIVPVKYDVRGNELHVEGELPLKHTDIGLTPFSLFGGALRVLDEMKIRFRIVARSEG